MTDSNDKLLVENKKPTETVQELKDEHKVPSFEEFMKTYEEDDKVNKSYEKEIDSCVGIGIGEGYGPCPENWFDSNTGDYVRTTIKIREFRLIVRITGGTWWYYTDDKTSGVGGKSSWWDSCGFFTKITQFGLDSQWRTDQILMESVEDARKTLRAFNNERIIVVNDWGCDSENSRITKRNTIKKIEWAISRWERGENVDADTTA